MSTRIRSARCLFVALTLLGLANGSQVEAVTLPATQKKPKVIIDPKARAVFEALGKVYSALKTYSCVCYSQSVSTGRNSSTRQAVSQIQWKPGAIAVLRRSHTTAFWKWERSQTVCKAGVYYNWTSLFPKQYTKQSFKSNEKGIEAALQEGDVSGLTLLGDPSGEPAYDDPSLREIWLLSPGKVAGVPVQRVRVLLSDEEGNSILTIAIDTQTHVLRQKKLLYFYQSGASVEETETYTNIALNPALHDNVFSFAPPPGATFDQKTSDMLNKLPPDYDIN